MGKGYNVDDILSEVRRKKVMRSDEPNFDGIPREAELENIQKQGFVLADPSDDVAPKESFVTKTINTPRDLGLREKQINVDQSTRINISSDNKVAKPQFGAGQTKLIHTDELDDQLDKRRKERVSQFMGDISGARERLNGLEFDNLSQNDPEGEAENPLKKFFGGMHKDGFNPRSEPEPEESNDDEGYMSFSPDDDDDEEQPKAGGLLGRFKGIKPKERKEPDADSYVPPNAANDSLYDEDEFNSPKDTFRVKEDIWANRNKILIRVVITTSCFLTLFYLAVSNFVPIPLPSIIYPEERMANFIMANLLVLLISILSSATVIGNGLISMFTFKADQDTPTALAAVVTFGHGIALAVNPDYISYGQGHFYFVAAGLILMFNAIGSYLMILRIWDNFKIASSGEVKRGFYVTDEAKISEGVTQGQDLEQPVLAYTAPISFPQNFLALSYDNSDGINKITSPLFLFFAFVISGVSYFVFNASPMNTLTYFTAMILVSCPLTSTLMVNLPLFRAAKKLNPRDSYITGDEAINEIEPANALVVDAADLYPSKFGVLYGIKPMDNTLINQSITDMASVMHHINGSLKQALLAVINNDKSMLKVVEQVSFVDGKGIIANIEGRTVLIGNRELLLHYKIDAPSRDYEFKLTKGTKSVLYITNNDKPAAIFVVGYNPDLASTRYLKALNRRGVALCVRSFDPNITVEKIAEDYKYKAEYINIISSAAHNSLSKLTAKRSKSKAYVMCSDDPQGFFRAFTLSYTLKRSITFAVVIQLIGLVLGYATIAFLSFTGSITNMSFIHLVLYQLIWALMVGITLLTGTL